MAHTAHAAFRMQRREQLCSNKPQTWHPEWSQTQEAGEHFTPSMALDIGNLVLLEESLDTFGEPCPHKLECQMLQGQDWPLTIP